MKVALEESVIAREREVMADEGLTSATEESAPAVAASAIEFGDGSVTAEGCVPANGKRFMAIARFR